MFAPGTSGALTGGLKGGFSNCVCDANTAETPVS